MTLLPPGVKVHLAFDYMWIERGGPPVVAHTELEGFGSKLVHRSMLTSPPSRTSLMSRSSEDFLTAP